MNRYIYVANVGDFMLDNVRASYEAAANRWEVDFVEYIGDRDSAIEDKFAGIEEFNDDDMLMIADADILYRIDSPSPFQYATDFGISAVSDVQRERHDPYDFWGKSTEKGVAYWALQRGFDPENCLPINTGVLIGTVETFKRVRGLYNEICSSVNWDHMKVPQAIFPVVCEELEVPLIKMPRWVNRVNVTRHKGFDDFPDRTPMEDYSFHPAGVPEPLKSCAISNIDWTIRPGQRLK